MSSKAKRHTHKYYQVKISYQTVWACALPDCNHYMPAHMTHMMPGKATLCWKCEKTTFLDPENLERDKPLCEDCRPIPSANLDEFLESKGLINPITGK